MMLQGGESVRTSRKHAGALSSLPSSPRRKSGGGKGSGDREVHRQALDERSEQMAG